MLCLQKAPPLLIISMGTLDNGEWLKHLFWSCPPQGSKHIYSRAFLHLYGSLAPIAVLTTEFILLFIPPDTDPFIMLHEAFERSRIVCSPPWNSSENAALTAQRSMLMEQIFCFYHPTDVLSLLSLLILQELTLCRDYSCWHAGFSYQLSIRSTENTVWNKEETRLSKNGVINNVKAAWNIWRNIHDNNSFH